jgi:hypothetical protein
VQHGLSAIMLPACTGRACSPLRHMVGSLRLQEALTEAESEEAEQQQQSQQGTTSPGKLTRSSQSLTKGSQRPSKGSFRARISHDVLGTYMHSQSANKQNAQQTMVLACASVWGLQPEPCPVFTYSLASPLNSIVVLSCNVAAACCCCARP